MILQISDNCIACGRKFGWNEVIIGKVPENVWFDRECAEKYPDDKVYKGIDSWIVTEYQPGMTAENNNI